MDNRSLESKQEKYEEILAALEKRSTAELHYSPFEEFKPYQELTALITRAFDNSFEHGFWDEIDEDDVNIQLTKIALMHSELSEALEAARDGKLAMEIVNGKPEGLVVELADCLIRIFDLCKALRVDLAEAVLVKMAFNETRPFKHGRKA